MLSHLNVLKKYYFCGRLVYFGYISKEYLYLKSVWPYRGEGWVCSDDDFLFLNGLKDEKNVKEKIKRAFEEITKEIKRVKLYQKMYEKLEEERGWKSRMGKEELLKKLKSINGVRDTENLKSWNEDNKNLLELLTVTNREIDLNDLEKLKRAFKTIEEILNEKIESEESEIALYELMPIIGKFYVEEYKPSAPRVINQIWESWFTELGELIRSRPALFERVMKSEKGMLLDFSEETQSEKDLSLSSIEKLFMLFDMSQEMLFRYYEEPIM
jgi:hypothetical protein